MPVPIYHFSHRGNLETILNLGALYCDRQCQSRGLATTNIAYSNLKAIRARTTVEAGPGGTLDAYVPFYFGTRSPMMYTYMNGNVTGKREDLDEIVYFASTAETIATAGHPYVFTDGHPVKEPRAFFDDIGNIREVDLPLMDQKMWKDTDVDPDRMRRRQAEFLVYDKVPLSQIHSLATRSLAMQTWVSEMLARHSLDISCIHMPQWYY